MKIAIIAEQNFNLIDGSTIWLLNVCKLLARTPDIQATLILSHHLENTILADEVPNNIQIVDTESLKSIAHFPDNRLTDKTLIPVLSAWENEKGAFDRFFVRGESYLTYLLQHPRYRDRTIAYASSIIPDIATETPDWLKAGLAANAPVVVQSDVAKCALESLCDYPADLVHTVPPIVFQPGSDAKQPARTVTLCYSGKIDKYYGLDWFIDICRATFDLPKIKVHIIAGKDTYRSRSPDFFKSMDLLRHDINAKKLKGVSLDTAVSHSTAKNLMAKARLAYCLRHPQYDDNIEISTKIVEFCTLGVPPILNDNGLNRSLFGDDYPYLVDITKGNISQQVLDIMMAEEQEDYQKARAVIKTIAAQFSAESLAKTLGNVIRGSDVDAPKLTQKSRHILIATHETKFIKGFLNRIHADKSIRVDWEHWISTATPPKKYDQMHADTIFCEWCCENAVWHSKNKLPGRKLIIRLHRFEAFRDFPNRVNWQNVDALIVVSDHFRDIAINNFGVDPKRISVQPQYINWQQLQRPKTAEAKFTVGMVGINPFEHKRFDRAIDFFAELHKRDNRFKMAIRSVMPWEISWVWNDNAKMQRQFSEVFQRIFSDPVLSTAIRFDPAGSDMEEWYRDIGTILSSSDSEGCHTSVIEGMASGAYPVVYNWPGAHSLFSGYVHDDMKHAINDVINFAKDTNIAQQRQKISESVKIYDIESFSKFFFKL